MKINNIQKNNSRAGQLLIEMLVALGILTMGFLGVTALLSRALGLNRVISDNYTATYLASEGIEIAKNIIDGRLSRDGWGLGGAGGPHSMDFRDTTWKPDNGGLPLTYDDIAGDPNQYQYGYGFDKTTPFVRTINVNAVSGNELVVTSHVVWASRGGGIFEVLLEDHFFNWRT